MQKELRDFLSSTFLPFLLLFALFVSSSHYLTGAVPIWLIKTYVSSSKFFVKVSHIYSEQFAVTTSLFLHIPRARFLPTLHATKMLQELLFLLPLSDVVHSRDVQRRLIGIVGQ